VARTLQAGAGTLARRRAGGLLPDLVAGVSVALVLIPQSLAYAELAGMPAYRGLYAAALPLVAAGLLASSPYLQTGPVALTSLLTFAALSPLADPGGADYVALGLVLALVVGAVRLLLGLVRAGVLAYLMSQPMLMGFVPAAALLIVASQLPAAVQVAAPGQGVLTKALWTLAHPGAWRPGALLLGVATVALMLGGRRLSPLFPGVLAAVVLGIGVSLATGYDGPTIGAVQAGLPPLSVDLRWAEAPSLLVPGAVIALVGFAEPTSIARTFAIQERKRWDPDRELTSQGAANLVAGLAGGFPVGGSFSRSALNRLAGARTRLSGLITGLAVLAFLPMAGLLAPLPKAVLAAIVIGSVAGLIRIQPLLRLWRHSKPQFAVASATFALTLLLAPRIEWAVLAGVGLAVAVHLWRELRIDVDVASAGDTLVLRPKGVLWFGSAQTLEQTFIDLLAGNPQAKRLRVDLGGLGRIDVTGALSLRRVLDDARGADLDVELCGVHAAHRRLVQSILRADRLPL
jgi:SulP family sulfate permease